MNLTSTSLEFDPQRKALIFIPARLRSSRLDQKLLQQFAGKTLLEHTVLKAVEAREIEPSLIKDVILASDSLLLTEPFANSDCRTFLSRNSHPNGSSRIQEALGEFIHSCQEEVKIIINLQADQPAIHPKILVEIAGQLSRNREISVLTPVMPANHLSQEFLEDRHQVKALVRLDGVILKFSRNLVELQKLQKNSKGSQIMFHVGVYGYQMDVFQNIPFQSPSPGALKEDLEQLIPHEKGISFHSLTIPFEEALLGIDSKSDYDRLLKNRFPNEIHR